MGSCVFEYIHTYIHTTYIHASSSRVKKGPFWPVIGRFALLARAAAAVCDKADIAGILWCKHLSHSPHRQLRRSCPTRNPCQSRCRQHHPTVFITALSHYHYRYRTRTRTRRTVETSTGTRLVMTWSQRVRSQGPCARNGTGNALRPHQSPCMAGVPAPVRPRAA
eukprot:COSAG01_NODE_36_length_34092_cov_26.350032_7_plen_165_part_00